MKRLPLLLALCFSIGLASCGSDRTIKTAGPTGVVDGTGEKGGAAGPGEIDWDNPILGVAVPSLADASKAISFVPLSPTSLGNSSKILVQLGVSNKQNRLIAFLFDHPSYGHIIVIEWKPAVPPDEYNATLQSLPARVSAAGGGPGAGHAELVTIRGGIGAVLTQPDDYSRAVLRWVEAGIVIEVEGPLLRHDDAIAVANGL